MVSETIRVDWSERDGQASKTRGLTECNRFCQRCSKVSHFSNVSLLVEGIATLRLEEGVFVCASRTVQDVWICPTWWISVWQSRCKKDWVAQLGIESQGEGKCPFCRTIVMVSEKVRLEISESVRRGVQNGRNDLFRKCLWRCRKYVTRTIRSIRVCLWKRKKPNLWPNPKDAVKLTEKVLFTEFEGFHEGVHNLLISRIGSCEGMCSNCMTCEMWAAS